MTECVMLRDFFQFSLNTGKNNNWTATEQTLQTQYFDIFQYYYSAFYIASEFIVGYIRVRLWQRLFAQEWQNKLI